MDPAAQKRLRGRLEKLDYTAYASNCAVVGQTLGPVGEESIQRLAVAAATARADWIRAAFELADAHGSPAGEAVASLARRRAAFEELAAAYEGVRRLIERGYLPT